MAAILTFPADASGIPKVEPSAAPPEDYEKIQTTPGDFGAQVGQAEEKLGEGAIKASHVFGQIAGQQAATGYMDESEQVLTDYLGKHGQEAMEAQPRVAAQLKSLREKYSGMLSTAESQIEFNSQTRFLQSRQLGQLGNHYDQESKVWGNQVSDTRYSNAVADAALHPEDEDSARAALGVANSARIQGMQLKGLLPRDISQLTDDQAAMMAREQRQTLVDVTEARIKALAVANPAAARRLYDANTAVLSSSKNYDALGYSLMGHEATAQRKAEKAEDDVILHSMSGGGAPRALGPSGAITAPPQYAPLIKQAADQHGVPEELLTRVLSAESGFNPQAKGPPIAKLGGVSALGIAQFIPATAAKYGIDPHDATQAIPGAAHYLADLKAETGTWNGAVAKYLGTDPHNDAQYRKAGVPQLVDELDGRQPNGSQMAARGGVEVWGDSLGVGVRTALTPAAGAQQIPGHTHGGDSPTTIFNSIKAQPADHWQGKTVVLPSGSNGNEMPVVEDTIKYLKANGAKVIAVGYGSKFPEKNAALAEIAGRQQVPVVAAEDVGAAEGVHPSPAGYKTMAQKIGALSAQIGAAPAVTPPQFDTQHADGMVKPGNLDPWHRPVLHNPDGSYSTTSSMSIDTDAGEVLIPTVIDGKRLSDDDAVAHFRATGENLGTFSTPDQANAYATALHNAQASMGDANGNPKALPGPDQLQGQPAAPASPMTAPVPYFPSREEYLSRIPEGLSDERYGRLYGKANQQYSRMVQTTSADRATALAQYKGGMAMLQDGRDFEYDPNTYRRLFPKENADQMIGDLEDARAIGQQVQGVRGMPLAEIGAQHAANQAVLAKSTGEGYERQKKRAAAFDTAAERHIKALGEDPAAYVISTNPEIEKAREATAAETPEQSAVLRGQGEPDAVESFAAKLLGEQERLGVPEDGRHVLSTLQAQASARQIMQDPEHAPAALKAMQERWGTAWPEVWRDIVSVGKLSPAYQMVGALENEGDGALLARGLAEANKAGATTSIDKLLDTKVAGAIKPSAAIATRIAGNEDIQHYKRSMLNSGASPDQVEGIISAIGTLAKAKVLYHGEGQDEAADHAVESAIGKFEFLPQGGARVPRANVDAITDNARAAVERLDLAGLRLPPRFAMMAPNDQRYTPSEPGGIAQGEDWLRVLKANPSWITVGQSIRLMDNGGRFVRRSNGSFIEVPFDAKPIAQPGATASAGYPTGDPAGAAPIR